MSGIDILGTGCYAPSHTLSNDDLSTMVDTSDEWIYPRTGIKKRHISQTENTSELAYQAAKKALENSGVSKEDIGFIIVATCSADHIMPSVACMLQKQLGLSEQVMAFDMNAACTGFVYALSIANAMLATRPDKLALVIGAEVFSKMLDYTDRSTCILFGDGAGAVVVERCEASPGILGRALHSDGTGGGVLQCGARELTTPYARTSAAKTDQKQQTDDREHYIQMDGQEVYRFATRRVPQCIEEALSDAGLAVPDIDMFVLHQANARIIDAVAKRLHADREKFPTNLERVGNLSSASIPVLLDEQHRQGKLHRGDRIVLAGFGAGLTIGACVMTW